MSNLNLNKWQISRRQSDLYGFGSFLLAGAEIIRMKP
ncbi:hypothetical protein BH11VER1_BH11VER1_20280 [soil metagenome]